MSERISRRNLLGRGLCGISLAATAPHFLDWSSRVLAAEVGGDKVLVVVQLSGGNDGLSMVVPCGDPAYYRARKTTAIKESEVLPLDDGAVGLHPGLKPLHALYREGRLAIVQGASYPNPQRSHFKSMDIWHTADQRGRGVDTGWLGRAIDASCPREGPPELTVSIGQAIPYALEAERHKPISFDTPERYAWTGNPRDAEAFEDLNEGRAGEQRIDWLHRVAADARGSSQRIRTAARGYRPEVEYPRGGLAGELRVVAALIDAGLDTRIYYVSFGGFDTHNNQRGRHDGLMRQLGPALGAFYRDLKAKGHADRVLTMSFSEFSRRVEENGSGGTDHGVAGPMLLLGDGVTGGLHGKHPSLTELDKGDLVMETDFRTVYAAVLERWMGVDSATVLGKRFEPAGVL